VKNLRQRSILESTADLEDLSTDSLIQLVKSVVTGPTTWYSRDSGFTPEISQEIVLHTGIAYGGAPFHREGQARLLPSGRYVLFSDWRTIECWDVLNDQLVWKPSTFLDNATRVMEFAAEETEPGISLVLMMCQHSGDRK
jgi:hypothetical protein